MTIKEINDLKAKAKWVAHLEVLKGLQKLANKLGADYEAGLYTGGEYEAKLKAIAQAILDD